MIKSYAGKKRQIQSYFYNKVKTNSNIVALAGNNLDLHIKDFKHILNTPSKKAYVYDLSKEVVNKFKYLEDSYQIELINDNILNCKPERFMDIDLMATLGTIQGIVYYLFSEQVKRFSVGSGKNSKMTNTFMFTYASRGNKKDLGEFVIALLKGRNIQLVSLEHKSYRDTSPMNTVQIQWRSN